MVSGVKWCLRQYRLQALAMVIHLAMGENHIRLAIIDHFLLEMKGHITTDLIRVPTGQFVFLFGHHTIGIVKFQIGDAAYVLLMIRGIEQVRKESLF